MCQSRLTHGLVQPFTRWSLQHKHKIHKTRNNFNTSKEPANPQICSTLYQVALPTQAQNTQNTKQFQLKPIVQNTKKSRLTRGLAQPFTRWAHQQKHRAQTQKNKNHKLILTQIQLLQTQKKSRINHDLVQPFTRWPYQHKRIVQKNTNYY